MWGRRGAVLPRGVWGAWLVACTALGAWFALRHLGRVPFWRDEVATMVDAHRSLGGTWDVMLHREGNMWPNYVLINGWSRLGTSEGFIRLPGALFAVATVPLTMVLARRAFGDVAAIAAGLALALNTMLMDVAQEARSYGLVVMLAALSTLLLVRAVERPGRRAWVVWALAAALMIHCHMLASLVVVAQLASLAFLPRAQLPVRQLAAGVLVLAVAVAPMAVYAVTRDAGQTGWITGVTINKLGGFAKTATGGLVLIPLYAALFVAVAGATVAQLRAFGRSRATWLQSLVLLWVLLPPVALAAVSLARPLFSQTYLIGVVPGVALLVGVAMTTLRRGAPALGAGALVLAVTGVAAATHPRPAGKGEDLRAAASYVARHAQAGDGVAYAPAFARAGFAYYLARVPRAGGVELADLDMARGQTPERRGDLFAGEASPRTVARRLQEARRVWLVGYPGANWHPTPEPVLAVAPAILRRAFVAAPPQRFGGFVVRLYRRR